MTHDPSFWVMFEYNNEENMKNREKYLIRIGLIFGVLIGTAIGILLMYSLHLVGWY